MANNLARQEATYRDLRGHIGKVSFFYSFNATIAANTQNAFLAVQAIIANISLLTNAALVRVTGLTATVLPPNAYGSNTSYSNCETKARLVYQVFLSPDPSVTSQVHIDIPAPNLTMFFADRETVNPASIAALTAALQTPDATSGQAASKNDFVFGPFLGGLLVRRKLQRKLTIYDKSPNLDEPEE